MDRPNCDSDPCVSSNMRVTLTIARRFIAEQVPARACDDPRRFWLRIEHSDCILDGIPAFQLNQLSKGQGLGYMRPSWELGTRPVYPMGEFLRRLTEDHAMNPG